MVGLAEQVARIDAGRLDSRLDAAGLPSEMTPIQEGVNTLLERIDEAMQREKRFTMAAAHELRTPVAELRMLLEVSAARPRTLEESERTVAAALSSVLRLDRLVSDLLRLSRLERGRESTNLSDVSIADLVRAAVEDSRALADARKVRFEFTPAEDRVVRVDAGLLKLGVGNLIANAAQYADEGSCVQIAMTDGSAGVVVRIENAASEFQPDDAARLGEPLWRGDRARSDAGHLGLGLTIARAALAASGAGLRIGWTGEGGGCVVAEVAIGHQ